jgi:hypothetical protein
MHLEIWGALKKGKYDSLFVGVPEEKHGEIAGIAADFYHKHASLCGNALSAKLQIETQAQEPLTDKEFYAQLKERFDPSLHLLVLGLRNHRYIGDLAWQMLMPE